MSEETKNTETTTTSKQGWCGRIISAIIGVIVAVGSLFGITEARINNQVEKTKEITALVTEAKEALAAGDTKTATEKLTAALETSKEVVETTKEIINEIKDKEGNVTEATSEETKTEVKEEEKK